MTTPISRHAAIGRPSILQLITPFWRTRESRPAWVALALVLTIMFGGTYLSVWANKLVADVTDSLLGRDWALFLHLTLVSTAVGLATGSMSIVNYIVHQRMELRWRTWLTQHFLNRWTAAHAYYDIERDAQLSNADQRIAEDIRLFVDQTLNMGLNITMAVVQGITYGMLLWHLSGTLRFTLGGHDIAIPGYMLYLSFAYTALELALVHWVGKAMVGLSIRKQTVEADYRYLAMQLRENAEQVAFYRGGPRERGRLLQRFEQVRHNTLEIIKRTGKVMLMQTAYGKVFHPVPMLAALPRYFAGEITMGGLTRVTSAFSMFNGTLSLFSQAYTSLTELLAITNRLRDLSWALHKAETREAGITVAATASPVLGTSLLRLHTPLGERWLVRGPSGTGKSTLLRAVAGLWPFGEGHVDTPAGATMLFLPQRSYIPAGPLKSALAYPAEADAFSDADCREALHACGLAERMDSLTESDTWQQKLSGGEQQRLAIARVLLHKPDFIFLDEATSALDEASEARAYEAILARLPGSALISVAHRSALLKYHDRVLDLVPTQRRQR